MTTGGFPKDTKVKITAGGKSVETTTGAIEQFAAGAPYPFPLEGNVFRSEDVTLARAEVLEDDVARLIGARDEFKALAEYEFAVLWKRGNDKWLGKAIKQGEKDLLLSGCAFVIIVSLTNCRERSLTCRQMEALLYHQLYHLHVDEKGRLTTVGHDVEEFHAVAAIYGAWEDGLKVLGEQLKLALEG